MYGNCLTIWMAIAGHVNTAKCWNQNLSSLVYIQKVLLRSQTTHLTNWKKEPPSANLPVRLASPWVKAPATRAWWKLAAPRFHLERANRNWQARNITKSVVYTHQLIRMIRISIFTLIGNVMKVPDFWIFTIPKTFTDNPSKIIPNSSHNKHGKLSHVESIHPSLDHWTLKLSGSPSLGCPPVPTAWDAAPAAWRWGQYSRAVPAATMRTQLRSLKKWSQDYVGNVLFDAMKVGPCINMYDDAQVSSVCVETTDWGGL